MILNRLDLKFIPLIRTMNQFSLKHIFIMNPKFFFAISVGIDPGLGKLYFLVS